ncbi:uncharacterized protein MYCFIDRAFT_204057 [Pseudocercospora fijiensis CIRAD86]|uniref:Pyruvate carboxylase n=1 Tax=Pseudocercospora fijiensis (strain CIRAD86) TaxID=383855 RepID=M2YSQ0_PSEFD|nr:uncharacterized protein MYCFIDRAFT_204057 [Pseudocercospora fijiensis CIRAD86]EME80730.1 hypothetical protein MYCFIDRAFT_204057 [Pseudocercospora fijiensis CIRAD86]
MSGRIQPRPIQRILVANRGEIAARILSTCRELGLETFAVFTENDVSHVYNASHAIKLESPSSYVNVDEIVKIVQEKQIDAVHPGYGFLSESSLLASRMAEINVMLVGPGAENLDRTGDKLRARQLAEECNVPVLPAFTTPTGKFEEVQSFAEKNGLPIMIKAVDGGGGRGIRLVRKMEVLQSLVKRAIEESPSKQVFAEKAAVDGYRHVEVQIVGDGNGNVMHLWERECSIQRRYQKIVELAPSMCQDRTAVQPIIEAAVRIAKKFLLNPNTKEFFFLEINPRLQVEHTITESICSTDIVQAQLRLAQGASFSDTGLDTLSQNPLAPPPQYSIQLRLTAEDPEKNYSLSIGKIQSFKFPSGVGTRVDTALVPNIPAVVTSDFDSVIAKIIITARTWPDTVSKARRALDDTQVKGIQTNLALLRAIVRHPDFENGQCDTQWLESKHEDLLTLSRKHQDGPDPLHGLVQQESQSAPSASSSHDTAIFKKDDAWTITLTPHNVEIQQQQQPYHLQLTKILKNNFPASFAAEILYTSPASKPVPFTLALKSSTASGSAMGSSHPYGNPSDARHVIIPISGKLVEVLVEVGDAVRKDEPVCVIKQMKMEVEVRSHRGGVVSWVTEAEDGEDIAEGMLAAVIVEEERVGAKL